MKIIILITLFLIQFTGYGQINPFIIGVPNRSKLPGYEAQDKYDTVKIRILYDRGDSTPGCKDGYVVRRWYVFFPGFFFGGCIDCPPSSPNRWFDTEELLEKSKFGRSYNTIDKRKVWQYRYNE